MTYKLGPFYLTTLTFPNPIFVNKNDEGRHPTSLGANTTSVTKEVVDYEYMARSLKKRNVGTPTFGSDGECAMEKGFENVFPITNSTETNLHLRCFDNVKADMLAKLEKFGIADQERRKITNDILGREFNGTRINGLVDCDTELEFDSIKDT